MSRRIALFVTNQQAFGVLIVAITTTAAQVTFMVSALVLASKKPPNPARVKHKLG